jgi:thioester reductase-like protein
MAVLLTGATGFVGMEILARLLERSDAEVLMLVRAADEAAAESRVGNTLECLFGSEHAYRDRVSPVRADLERPGLGLSAAERESLAENVTSVVHSAASISFTLPLAEARRVNVEGTRQVLELAELCERRGGIENLSYISTAYVAGDHPGVFGEHQLDVGQGFRNSYERSKFEAERLVRTHANRLPIQIFRPSIVVGEEATGWTAAFNVLYAPLKAFARGALPALPARRPAPVDVVPVDYVADAVFELSRRPVEGCPTYHLVAGRRATTVGRLIELTVDRLGRREPVVIHPTLFRRLVYPLLVRSRPKAKHGLERTKVYFPYFAVDVTYDDEHARRRLEPAGVEVPPIESYFDRLLGYAIAADWGRRPLTRAGAWDRLDGERRHDPRASGERVLSGV